MKSIINTQANRQTFLQTGAALASLGFIHPLGLLAADDVPQSVAESSADFDPRKDPLETEVIREFNVDGAVIRHVRFLVGTFNGKLARMTPINSFPEQPKDANGNARRSEKLPAVMHIHGGGQRAFLHEVKFLVSRGQTAGHSG